MKYMLILMITIWAVSCRDSQNNRSHAMNAASLDSLSAEQELGEALFQLYMSEEEEFDRKSSAEVEKAIVGKEIAVAFHQEEHVHDKKAGIYAIRDLVYLNGDEATAIEDRSWIPPGGLFIYLTPNLPLDQVYRVKLTVGRVVVAKESAAQFGAAQTSGGENKLAPVGAVVTGNNTAYDRRLEEKLNHACAGNKKNPPSYCGGGASNPPPTVSTNGDTSQGAGPDICVLIFEGCGGGGDRPEAPTTKPKIPKPKVSPGACPGPPNALALRTPGGACGMTAEKCRPKPGKIIRLTTGDASFAASTRGRDWASGCGGNGGGGNAGGGGGEKIKSVRPGSDGDGGAGSGANEEPADREEQEAAEEQQRQIEEAEMRRLEEEERLENAAGDEGGLGINDPADDEVEDYEQELDDTDTDEPLENDGIYPGDSNL